MPNFSLPERVFAEAVQRFQTPFHLYDERGIRATIDALNAAFAGLPDFREYFAVKALPTPAILRIFRDAGCGLDCASLTELMLAEATGFSGDGVMFSANVVPPEEFALARRLGAHINLDDITLIDALRDNGGIPEEICLRFNPGDSFNGENAIMGNPSEAKFGMTRPQLLASLSRLRGMGVRAFGLHAFLSSNTRDAAYYPALARLLYETGAELAARTGLRFAFINLSGGIGIPYLPDEPVADIAAIGAGVRRAYEECIVARGLPPVSVKAELGRYMTGPHGWLVTRALHEKRIHRRYLGVDASACDLMRPAMYGAYHHITAVGYADAPCDCLMDVTGALCENNDKFAENRLLPDLKVGDLLVIHDTGAHGRSMGYNYNGKLRCGEVLYRADGTFALIRRAETPADYFATLSCDAEFGALTAEAEHGAASAAVSPENHPATLIETPRLLLREMTPADYGALSRILQDEQVMYAYNGAYSEAETRAWLEKQLARYRADGFGLWAVVLKETGEMIGQCGLTTQPWRDRLLLEVGYLFQRAHWHRGYASEAARACRDYAFRALDADAVYSIIRDTNAASMNVAKRNGMTRADAWVKPFRGQDVPHVLFCVRRSDIEPEG